MISITYPLSIGEERRAVLEVLEYHLYLPETKAASRRVVSLPVHLQRTLDRLETIAATVYAFEKIALTEAGCQ